MKIQVVALMNDSVGTQVATAYDYGYCDLAVIIATGTNASYMEKIENIKKLNDTNYHFDQVRLEK
uniref:Phosphotransferase n=1 Tax=Romanomermis culicivorax TaxID=13658 RepID=A0A915KB94_ROMCU